MAEYFSRSENEDEDEKSWQVTKYVASWTKKTPVEHCHEDSSGSRSSQIHLKNEFVDDLVALPYPQQETDRGTEGVGNQSEKIVLQEEDYATSTCSNTCSSDSTEQNAKEVTSLECNFEDTKSSENEHKSSFGRHAIGKVEKNVNSITEPEPPPVLHKTAKTNKVKKRRIPSFPVREVPKDSNEYRSGSGSGGGVDRAKKQKTKEGQGGRLDIQPISALDNAEQYPSPGCGEATITDQQSKEEMKVDIPAMDNRSESQEKMQYCNPAIPSMLENPEQCHSPGRSEAATSSQKFDISLQDLQHACYCCKPVTSKCHNEQCKDVKAEIKHMKDHQGWKQRLPCTSCAKTHAVIQKHAKVCHIKGCRVPYCHNIRNGTHDNKGTGKRVPTQVPQQNPAPSEVNNLAPERDKHKKKAEDKSDVDGKVLFWNFGLKLPPSNYFRENTDYTVDRNCGLGSGSNGTIFRVSLLKERKEIAVKQTNFRKKELEVYKSLGMGHKNIVTHYGVTLRGSDYSKVNIFMEKCDLSLFKHMQNLKRRLSVNEAMFYWVQGLDGVYYLHNLSIPVIHKDIKGKNVLQTEENGRVLAKLCDFDSAMRLPNEFTEAGLKPCGTEGFMSHEVINRKSHGKPTDIYSMGCFLIELTIGVPTKDTLKEKIDKLREVDADLAQLVEACVKECPEERPTACSLLEYPVVKKYTNSSRFVQEQWPHQE